VEHVTRHQSEEGYSSLTLEFTISENIYVYIGARRGVKKPNVPLGHLGSGAVLTQWLGCSERDRSERFYLKPWINYADAARHSHLTPQDMEELSASWTFEC